MYIVGIDIAKKTHMGGITDDKGNHIGKSFKIDNSVEGFENLLKKLAEVNADISQFVFGMEATGHYWLNLYTWLCDRNFTVHVINPIQSDALRKLEIRQTKTDSIDSYLIADCIRLGKYCDTNLADDDMLALRDLTRQRFYLVDMTSDIKKKVIAMMDRIFPEYESLFSDMFGKTSRDLLKECTTPEEILALDTTHLAEILRKSSKGRFKQEKAEELQKTARNSFAVLLSSQTNSLLVKQMIEQIELLESQISEIEKIIEQLYSKFDCKLTKIPGMGITLAAVILSEIGDISRFPDPKQLTAFAGLDPVLKQSGMNKGLGYHMSKRGSPYLRRDSTGLNILGCHFRKGVVHNRLGEKGQNQHHRQKYDGCGLHPFSFVLSVLVHFLLPLLIISLKLLFLSLCLFIRLYLMKPRKTWNPSFAVNL